MITDKKQQIKEWLETLPEDVTITAKEVKETRSGQQNRLYHKWLADIVGEFDKEGIHITRDDLHDGLREKLIESTIRKNTFTGELQQERRSTTKLNKTEFSKYIQDIEKYLIQNFDISVPLATDFFYNK